MTPLSEYFKRDSAYFGERLHWLVAATVHRDSDCLERSNFRSFLKLLGGEGEQVAIERASHWAVGWLDYLIIDPEATELVTKAEEALAGLENYPVLDEEDFSELEREEADQIWKNCYDVKERIAYVRKYSSQFEFRDFRDMLSCIRGNYFAGYASELCSR